MPIDTIAELIAGKSLQHGECGVWDRLWRHSPSNRKDDALLVRERRSPRWGLIVNRLKRDFSCIKGLRTVELGAGRGDLSVLLAQCGAEVTLLDSSEAALTQARRRFARLRLPATFLKGDLFDIPQDLRGRFHVSLSSGVIEHFRGQQRTRAVRAHYDVLRRGGMAVMSVPHAWCLPYRIWKAYLELRGWWPYGFERAYSRKELVTRAHAVELERVEARCVGFWQSMGDHVFKGLLGVKRDWVDRRSWFDSAVGMTLVVTARRKL